jgi:hypothetical protein
MHSARLCWLVLFSKVATIIRIAVFEKGVPMSVEGRVKLVGRRLALVALVGSLVALSACKVFVKEEPPPCPRVSILADAAKLVQFREGTGRDLTDITLKAEIVNYHGSCFYDKSGQSMTLTVQVGIDAERGVALIGDSASISYFIAVPEFFPQPAAKKVLPLTLQFSKNSDHLHATDGDVQITFPIKSLKEMERYEVFIGLQLDQAQLDYNRQHSGRD